MRYIAKTEAPKSLERWKTSNKTKTYSDLGKEQPEIKSQLKQQLIEEQKYICCYCEREVDVDISHIEHFEPQSIVPKRQLDYTNMLISCCDTVTCGHIKKSVLDPKLISPTEVDSLSHFAFGVEGSIIGTDERGEFTINTLNLNSETLKQQRKTLIDTFVECTRGGYDYIADYLTEDNGRYNKFFTTAEYLHNNGTI
ncbi:MAG: retron system putative HNH endonuclease [Rikenellaceae bacterium]